MGLPQSKLSATRELVESGKMSFKDLEEYRLYSRHDSPGDILKSDMGAGGGLGVTPGATGAGGVKGKSGGAPGNPGMEKGSGAADKNA